MAAGDRPAGGRSRTVTSGEVPPAGSTGNDLGRTMTMWGGSPVTRARASRVPPKISWVVTTAPPSNPTSDALESTDRDSRAARRPATSRSV